MNNKKNLITSLIFQIVTIISGLILPRLIISQFGSELNGLISSITQFLSFITLFEGGVGAAVLAELYKPIENKNSMLINRILNACNKFFKKLSILFIFYTFILMVLYPIFIKNSESYFFVSSLIFVLSINTLMQYMFSITNKLLLQADQKIYITNVISSITVVLNLLLTIMIINYFPGVHLVKIGSSIVFLIQPIFYNWYVNKKYDFKNNVIENYHLKNQKSAFGQNLAHFINMNTDIVLITTFLSLTDVSIYTVYLLPLNALRNIITTGSNSYQAALGKYLVQINKKTINIKFEKFIFIVWISSTVLFSACLLLINQFVNIYTTGIKDSIYYEPYFALMMCIAYFVYCLREPFRLLILAAGHFKETNFGAYMEAIINIVVSLILINYVGLVGVAIGTLVATLYRFIYLLNYIRKNDQIINLSKNSIMFLLIIIIILLINIYIYIKIDIVIDSLISFVIYGVIIFFAELLLFIAYILIRKIGKIKNV